MDECQVAVIKKNGYSLEKILPAKILTFYVLLHVHKTNPTKSFPT